MLPNTSNDISALLFYSFNGETTYPSEVTFILRTGSLLLAAIYILYGGVSTFLRNGWPRTESHDVYPVVLGQAHRHKYRPVFLIPAVC